jgi:hypothetical protein
MEYWATMRNFVIYIDHKVYFEQRKLEGYYGLSIWLKWRAKGIHTYLRWGNILGNIYLDG